METLDLEPLVLVMKNPGHVGAIAAAVFFLVRLYRVPSVQAMLPFKARWDNLPLPLKHGLLFGLAGLGGLLSSLAAGLPWQDALKAAGSAVVAAITGDQFLTSTPVKALAAVVFDLENKAPIVGVVRDGRGTGLVVPIPTFSPETATLPVAVPASSPQPVLEPVVPSPAPPASP